MICKIIIKNILKSLNKIIDSWLFRFHGEGMYIFSIGERFEGELIRGKKHGEGKYFYVNGNVYEGMWYNDLKGKLYLRIIYTKNIIDILIRWIWGISL